MANLIYILSHLQSSLWFDLKFLRDLWQCNLITFFFDNFLLQVPNDISHKQNFVYSISFLRVKVRRDIHQLILFWLFIKPSCWWSWFKPLIQICVILTNIELLSIYTVLCRCSWGRCGRIYCIFCWIPAHEILYLLSLRFLNFVRQALLKVKLWQPSFKNLPTTH